MSNKRLQAALVLLPLVCLLLIYFLDILISNTDALTYHLYYARVISEQNLNFFSERSTPLANELGFGLSAYYPWLYSHLVAICHRVFAASYDSSVLILSAFLYLVLISQYTLPSSKLLVASYLMMPYIFGNFFIAGTNYFLTAVLSYLLFRVISENLSVLRLLLLAVVSYLLINSHVFGIFICGLIFIYAFFVTKKYVYLWLILFSLAYQLAHNFMLTESITFPFLLEIFPFRGFDSEQWMIVQNQIKQGVAFECWNLGYKNYLFLLSSFVLLAYVITRAFFSKPEKFLLALFLLPTVLIYVLGFRHRIIFFSCFIFITIELLEQKQISLTKELCEVWNYLKSKTQYVAFILIFLLAVSSLFGDYSEQSGKTISIKSVKNCFYNSVSELSVDNKILFTETELMRVANPRNIEPVDGKNYTEMKSLRTASDFHSYLKSKGIKFLTHTPLSTQELEIAEHNSYSQYLPELINNGDLTLYKDCVAENHYNNKTLPTYQNKILRNWLIYEVK